MVKSSPYPCPPPQQVQAFLRGDLPDGETLSVRQHLAVCDSCAQQAVETDEVHAFLHRVRGDDSTGEAAGPPNSDSRLAEKLQLAMTGSLQGQPPGEMPARIGSFRVQRLIGQGAFGSVYLCQDPVLDRCVAVKVANNPLSWKQKEIDRFLEEGKIAASLDHPNIVRIWTAGTDAAIGPFIAMEFVDDCRTLASVLEEGPLEFDRACRIISQICSAVQHGHQKGVLHRDVKPANILLAGQDVVKVADFGLALTDDVQPTRRGEISGTPAYMSPEQVRGDAHLLDGRSDIWSIGVIFYECLSGKKPFTGKTTDQLAEQILRKSPKPLQQLGHACPKWLDQLITRMLSKEMEGRYASAGEIVALLNRHLNRRRRRWWLVLSAAAALAAVVLLLVGARLFWPPARAAAALGSTPAAGRLPPDAVAAAPRAPASDFQGDLLRSRPREVLFPRDLPFDSWHRDVTTKSVHVQTQTPALLSCGTADVSDRTLNAVIRSKGPQSRFGLFWGFREENNLDDEKVFQVAAVLIMSGEEFIEDRLRLVTLELVPKPAGGLRIRSEAIQRDLPLQLAPQSTWQLQVAFEGAFPAAITINGQKTQLDAELDNAHMFSHGEVGIYVRRANLVVNKLFLNP